MKKSTYIFPSVYETVGSDLKFVSKSLYKGLQLYDENDQSYLVGHLALTEGQSPNKLINSSPSELDYQLLLKSSLLLATENHQRPLVVTTGFPFSTYQVYKDVAKRYIENAQDIEYNPGTFSFGTRTTESVNIKQVEILPEMIGNIIALRAGETQAEGNFFVVSFGYGTCEAVLSTEDGIVHRTSTSITGMQYAVDLFMRSLATKYYLGLKTEKQLDISFRSDHIVLGRKKIGIKDLRKQILERYYRDVVSIGLRKSFRDNDFEMATKIYVTGGGALFPDLVNELKREFQEVAKVEVVNNPLTLTSEGYKLNSVMLADGDESMAVGLDIGNANTVISQYEPSLNTNLNETVSQKEEPIVYPNNFEINTEDIITNEDTENLEKDNIDLSTKEEKKKQAIIATDVDKPSGVDENIATQLIKIVDNIVTDDSKNDAPKKDIEILDTNELAELSVEEAKILLREGDVVNNRVLFDEFQPDFS